MKKESKWERFRKRKRLSKENNPIETVINKDNKNRKLFSKAWMNKKTTAATVLVCLRRKKKKLTKNRNSNMKHT